MFARIINGSNVMMHAKRLTVGVRDELQAFHLTAGHSYHICQTPPEARVRIVIQEAEASFTPKKAIGQERDRQTDRERKKERQKEKKRETEREREREREREKERERERERQKERERERERERKHSK